jgi:hypothetical protein
VEEAAGIATYRRMLEERLDHLHLGAFLERTGHATEPKLEAKPEKEPS